MISYSFVVSVLYTNGLFVISIATCLGDRTDFFPSSGQCIVHIHFIVNGLLHLLMEVLHCDEFFALLLQAPKYTRDK